MSTTTLFEHTARPRLWLYQHRYAGFRPFHVCTMVPPHTPHSTIPVRRYFESNAPTRREAPRLKPYAFCRLWRASCAVAHSSSLTMRRCSTAVTVHSSVGRSLSFLRPQASRFFVRPQTTSPL